MDKHFRKFFKDFDSLFNNDFDGLFNQTYGIMGQIKTETGKDSSGEFTKQTFTSQDGSIKLVSVVREYSDGKPKTSDLQSKIGELKAELEVLVGKQEFEKACEVRDKIKLLEENSQKKVDLETELEKAVREQNFEKAIEIRDQLKKIV